VEKGIYNSGNDSHDSVEGSLAAGSSDCFKAASLLPPRRKKPQTYQYFSYNAALLSFLSIAFLMGLSELPFFTYPEGRKIRTVFAPLNLRQFWRLFGPDLRTYNFHTLLVIEFADGTLKYREVPRMELLSVQERFIHEKLRSIFSHFLPVEINKVFFPAVARYYARANFDAENQPVKISFYFLYHETPPPDTKNWVYRDQSPYHTRKILHFVYRVMPSDLVSN